MPGDFTTTSQVSSASWPPTLVASPPAACAVPGTSSTSTRSQPIATSRSRVALPSIPSPKTPTRRPARSLNPIWCRMRLDPTRLEQCLERRCPRAARRELGQMGLGRPVRSGGGGDERRGALACVANALVGARAGAEADEDLEVADTCRVPERLGTAEDLLEGAA